MARLTGACYAQIGYAPAYRSAAGDKSRLPLDAFNSIVAAAVGIRSHFDDFESVVEANGGIALGKPFAAVVPGEFLRIVTDAAWSGIIA